MYDDEDLEEIREEGRRWNGVARAGPRAARRAERPVRDGFEPRGRSTLYPEDVSELDYLEDLGFPGEEPYTRGPYPTMYRGRTWTMRQFAGFGTAEETNERFHYLIDEGQTGLSVAFDMPSLMGLDSDDPP